MHGKLYLGTNAPELRAASASPAVEPNLGFAVTLRSLWLKSGPDVSGAGSRLLFLWGWDVTVVTPAFSVFCSPAAGSQGLPQAREEGLVLAGAPLSASPALCGQAPGGCSVLPGWEGRLPRLYPVLGHRLAAPACSQGRRCGKELGLAGVVLAL